MTAAYGLTVTLDPDGNGMPREVINLYIATITLTESQVWTLCDILPAADDMDQRWWNNAPAQLAEVINDRAREPHHRERWGVDHAALAKLCGNLTPPQGLALTDAVIRVRSAGGNDVESLRIVGLHR